MLAAGTLSAAASAMYLYYYNNYNQPMTWIWSYIGGTGQMGSPMYIYTKPVLKLQDRSRDHYILLNYLRRTYDPYYWSFSLGGDLTDWAAFVSSRAHVPDTNGPLGPIHKLGFDSVQPMNGYYPRAKDFIFFERVFRSGQRIDIKTAGNPFQAWVQNGVDGTHSFRELVGMIPTSNQLIGYNAMNCDHLGDLFIVDHYQSGPYHSVIIYDGFDIHTAYRMAAFSSPPPRPNDPEGGFLPPTGGGSGGIQFLPRTSTTQPWTTTGSDGTQTVYYSPCSGGNWYPEGAPSASNPGAPVLPCVDATNPPSSSTEPTMGTTLTSTSIDD